MLHTSDGLVPLCDQQTWDHGSSSQPNEDLWHVLQGSSDPRSCTESGICIGDKAHLCVVQKLLHEVFVSFPCCLLLDIQSGWGGQALSQTSASLAFVAKNMGWIAAMPCCMKGHKAPETAIHTSWLMLASGSS